MRKKRVVVAMSGGVDSSVTAALLQDQGLEVIGLTMQIGAQAQERGNSCCGIQGINDAKKVAAQLGIRHYVLNFRDIFREKVIVDFCSEYKQGRTPNPCIRCNQHIKFNILLNKALQLSADFLATGHYARIEFDEQSKKYLLKKGIDAQKDQSYVLYVMRQEQLQRTLMPLGALSKNRVREIARQKDLPIALKEESQEICFIPDNNYGEFVKQYASVQNHPGAILNKKGKKIGEHQGIIWYTIGQRKGLGLAEKEPLYVIAINKKENTIVVGGKQDVYRDELVAQEVNFISKERINPPLKVKVKVRYMHPEAAATIVACEQDKVKIKFDQPQWAVTPGQAAVFYSTNGQGNGDTVIGGGTIA